MNDSEPSKNAQRLSLVEPKRQTIKISSDQAEQSKLTLLLAKVFACQKTFGDRSDSFEMREQMFQELLGDYDFEKVEWAFHEYMRTHSDIPAPADVIAIINSRKWGVKTL